MILMPTFNSALGSNYNIIITIPANAPTKAVESGCYQQD